MGSNPIENKEENIVLNNQAPNEEIIEYQGYEYFPIVEMSNNLENKQDKIKPNPSMNNHSGGSSIGKYESEHREKQKEDKNNEEENNKMKIESKFHSQNEEIKNEKEEKGENDNINKENKDNKDINNNEVINNNENKEKAEEDIKKEEINEKNNNIAKEEENKAEEEKKENKEENGNINIKTQENENKEENINNINNEEEQKQKEENNKNNLTNDKNTPQENNMIENKDQNENKENTNMNNNTNTTPNINNHNENVDNNNNNNIKEEKKNENNKNEEFAPKKIILPDVNTIISEKVLEEGAGNELLFMSNLNKMDHISIKERVRYSEKFCITTKDNFLIYETRENYIKVKKPLAIIPINTIKNVVLFKLTKKIINYDHFYIEFQLDENNRNNVYNQIETFFINDLDNTNNENKGDTALVMFKTEEKNLAKKWYVLLKYLAELKLKN